MDQHDHQPHGGEDFLAVPEDEPAARGPAAPGPRRRRLRVRPLAVLSAAVTDDQRQQAPLDGGTVDAGTEVVRDHEHASAAELAVGQDVLVRVSPSGDAADLVVVDPHDDHR